MNAARNICCGYRKVRAMAPISVLVPVRKGHGREWDARGQLCRQGTHQRAARLLTSCCQSSPPQTKLPPPPAACQLLYQHRS